jgi:hypothetical protein
VWRSALSGEFETDDDGTTLLRLTAPLVWVDPDGTVQTVEKGSITDGASIPRWAESLIGGRYDGPWVRAAAMHDDGVQRRTEPWPVVHRRFYNGMRADGVSWLTAQVMFRAVWWFGDRWEVTDA